MKERAKESGDFIFILILFLWGGAFLDRLRSTLHYLDYLDYLNVWVVHTRPVNRIAAFPALLYQAEVTGKSTINMQQPSA